MTWNETSIPACLPASKGSFDRCKRTCDQNTQITWGILLMAGRFERVFPSGAQKSRHSQEHYAARRTRYVRKRQGSRRALRQNKTLALRVANYCTRPAASTTPREEPPYTFQRCQLKRHKQHSRLAVAWLAPAPRAAVQRRTCASTEVAHHRLVVIPVPTATVRVRHSRARRRRRRPRGRRVHVPRTPAPHRAEPMAATYPARPAAAAAGAPTAAPALMREHAHLGGRAATAPRGGVAVAGARVGGARVAPAGAIAAAGVLGAPRPLNADGRAANDMRRRVGDHRVECRGLARRGEGRGSVRVVGPGRACRTCRRLGAIFFVAHYDGVSAKKKEQVSGDTDRFSRGSEEGMVTFSRINSGRVGRQETQGGCSNCCLPTSSNSNFPDHQQAEDDDPRSTRAMDRSWLPFSTLASNTTAWHELSAPDTPNTCYS